MFVKEVRFVSLSVRQRGQICEFELVSKRLDV